MADIGDGESFACRNRGNGLTNQDSVHYNRGTGSEVSSREFMLRGNIRFQGMGSSLPFHPVALLQVGQCYKNVVAGIELEYARSHEEYAVRKILMDGSVTVWGNGPQFLDRRDYVFNFQNRRAFSPSTASRASAGKF